VSQTFRQGASFGKFLGLRLQVNHVDWLPLENGTACDTPTGARHSFADFLRRNWAEVGGQTQVLSVDLENTHVIGSAEARRALDDNVQYGLELRRRGADDPQNLGCRHLLLERLCEFIFQLRGGFADAADVSSRLRSLRTKTGNACSALRPFASQDHLVGSH
jgi:hypothetical protein